MATLHMIVQQTNKMSLRLVNRDEVIATRIQRAKQEAAAHPGSPGTDERPYIEGTPHTVEFNWDAAYAHIEQEGGSTDDIAQILAKEIVPLIAPEFDPADVDVELFQKKE